MESFYVIKCKFGKFLPSKRETIKLEKKNNPLELEGKKMEKKKTKQKQQTHILLSAAAGIGQERSTWVTGGACLRR